MQLIHLNLFELEFFNFLYYHYSAFSTTVHNTTCLTVEGDKTEPSDNINIFGSWFVIFLGVFTIVMVLNAVINVMNSGLNEKLKDEHNL